MMSIEVGILARLLTMLMMMVLVAAETVVVTKTVYIYDNYKPYNETSPYGNYYSNSSTLSATTGIRSDSTIGNKGAPTLEPALPALPEGQLILGRPQDAPDNCTEWFTDSEQEEEQGEQEEQEEQERQEEQQEQEEETQLDRNIKPKGEETDDDDDYNNRYNRPHDDTFNNRHGYNNSIGNLLDNNTTQTSNGSEARLILTQSGLITASSTLARATTSTIPYDNSVTTNDITATEDLGPTRVMTIVSRGSDTIANPGGSIVSYVSNRVSTSAGTIHPAHTVPAEARGKNDTATTTLCLFASTSTNPSTIASTNPSTIASTNPSTIASTNPSTIASTNPSTIASTNPSTITSTNLSTITSADTNSDANTRYTNPLSSSSARHSVTNSPNFTSSLDFSKPFNLVPHTNSLNGALNIRLTLNPFDLFNLVHVI